MNEHKISRRYVLLLAGIAFPALFFPRLRAILGNLLFSPKGDTVPVKPLPPTPFSQDGKSLVSIVKGQNIEQMVTRALEGLGGIEKLDVKGKEVLLKPNVVSSSGPPATTNPELIKSVVKFLYQAGAKKVKVGDSSAIITLPTKRNMEKTGIKKAAEEAGAEVLYFDDMDWVKVTPEKAKYATDFFISKPVYEAERIISLPVIKTHHAATYSISLKNWIGIIHPRNRPSLYRPKEWEEIIAEMNLPVHPHLIIADGTVSMIAGGPWKGTNAPTSLIMASGDRIAIDVAGLGLIRSFGAWERVSKISPWDQRQIKRAVELGLGSEGPDQIKIVSEALEGEDPGFEKLVKEIEGFISSQ